jgi:acyl-CoA synthetase (AMP-forming)/AMP-acid ligase II
MSLDKFLERSARANPTGIAIIEPGVGFITYGELDALANQLRDRLLHLGVGRGDRVGIYLHKSIDSVATIFGILKTGAAYVPVDPGSPVSRNVYILKDCQVKAVLLEDCFVTEMEREWEKNGIPNSWSWRVRVWGFLGDAE